VVWHFSVAESMMRTVPLAEPKRPELFAIQPWMTPPLSGIVAKATPATIPATLTTETPAATFSHRRFRRDGPPSNVLLPIASCPFHMV
jgi:hypothetical protein